MTRNVIIIRIALDVVSLYAISKRIVKHARLLNQPASLEYRS